MAVLKTAISLEENLYRRAEQMAKERQVSRSQFVAEALEKYIVQQEDAQLLEKINQVYEDSPAVEEMDQMLACHLADTVKREPDER